MGVKSCSTFQIFRGANSLETEKSDTQQVKHGYHFFNPFFPQSFQWPDYDFRFPLHPTQQTA